MIPKRSINSRELIRLLSKLKSETPEYPTDLLEARKSVFLKRVVDLKISGEGKSREGGHQRGEEGQEGGSGGAWAALKSGTAITGFSTKTTIAVGIVVVLLTAAYLFRDQIVDFLEENEIINVEETAAPPIPSTPTGLVITTPTVGTIPTFGEPSSGIVATEAAPGVNDSPDRTKVIPPPGLSQKPGTPTPPTPEGLAGRLRFLICVLRSGGENCR